MKTKTIKKVIRKKIDAWLDSLPEHIQKEVKDAVIVTGGSIVSHLLGEPVKDYDLYFRTREAAVAISKYYIGTFPEGRIELKMDVDASATPCPGRISIRVNNLDIFKQADDSEFADEKELGDSPKLNQDEKADPFHVSYMSSNAITLTDDIQLVVRFYGEPEQIHQNYDFVHCTCYWTSWDDKLVLPAAALESIITKDLKYVGSKYPLCSIIRTRKFIARQWKINAGQYLKMALQLNELDLSDVKVLQEQLVGVDSAYFYQVLAKIQETGQDKVDLAYITEIIDRIF